MRDLEWLYNNIDRTRTPGVDAAACLAGTAMSPVQRYEVW